MKADKKLGEYYLNANKNYNYLSPIVNAAASKLPEENAQNYEEFEKNLKEMGTEENHLSSVRRLIAAILLIGEIQFVENESGVGILDSTTADNGKMHI